MLKVTIELWPGGSSSRKTTLATLEIANMGGSQEDRRGNYEAKFRRPNGSWFRMTRVENYPRLSKHVWCLVARTLKNAGYK